KTIVTILARPIERWEYLLGRWAGVQAVAFGYLAIGLAAAAGLLAYMSVPIGMTFWLQAAGYAVAVVYLSGVSLAVGSMTAPAFAGMMTLLLMGLSATVGPFLHASNWQRIAAWVVYALCPAPMPQGLIGSSGAEPIDPQYGLFAAVLAENVAYTVAALLLAWWWFGRREIRARGWTPGGWPPASCSS